MAKCMTQDDVVIAYYKNKLQWLAQQTYYNALQLYSFEATLKENKL